MGLIRRGRPRRGKWTAGDVFWLAAPILAFALIVAYFVAAAALGTTPPFSVVHGQSMRPTFAPGDLVVIRGVAAHEVAVGDVISIVPPLDEQEEKGLPGEIVHRVVEIEGSEGQPVLITRGDNNSGDDAFRTFPSNIRGEVIARAPAVGFPLLFFRSDQGRIFAIAAGLAMIGYFVISAIERRQEAAALENPRTLIEEVRGDNVEIKEAMKELVGAVSEYGEHLRSHTGAVQGMSEASQHLASVAAELRGSVLTAPGSASAEAAPTATEEAGARADQEPTEDADAARLPTVMDDPDLHFLEALLAPPERSSDAPPVEDEPMPEAVHRRRPELTFEQAPPVRDLRMEVLGHLRLTADDGWIDLDLGVLSSALGAPGPSLESALAHLALEGHLRAVATRQSETYLVRLR